MATPSILPRDFLAGTTKKNRWGMIPTAATNPTPQHLDTVALGWSDFDHTQTLRLGDSGSTTIVYRKGTFEHTVLRFCEKELLTEEMNRLVELSRGSDNHSFLFTSCVFEHDDQLFVGSELSDMALADIIDCTISVQEHHLSSILNQVIRALCYLHNASLRTGPALAYGSLQARNIFVARDGTVKLAPFGGKIWPQLSTRDTLDQEREELRQLIRHLVSRSPDAPIGGVYQQKMISLPSIGQQIDLKFEPSPPLMDFLELCSIPEMSMERLAKHPFLGEGEKASLAPLVQNAERVVFRPCFSEYSWEV